MSGAPAIDTGMYNCGTGAGSASEALDVFATTPTIVSQGGIPSGEFGGVEDRTRLPIGSSPGKRASASALLTTTSGAPRPTMPRSVGRPCDARMPIIPKQPAVPAGNDADRPSAR